MSNYCVVYKIVKSGNEYRYGPKRKTHTARKLLERAVKLLELDKNLVRVGDDFYNMGDLVCTMRIEPIYKM
jgi:hypothetical protein